MEGMVVRRVGVAEEDEDEERPKAFFIFSRKGIGNVGVECKGVRVWGSGW